MFSVLVLHHGQFHVEEQHWTATTTTTTTVSDSAVTTTKQHNDTRSRRHDNILRGNIPVEQVHGESRVRQQQRRNVDFSQAAAATTMTRNDKDNNNNTAATSSLSSSSCLLLTTTSWRNYSSHSSGGWWFAEEGRLGNVPLEWQQQSNDDDVTATAMELILATNVSSLLRQTLCHHDSPFVTKQGRYDWMSSSVATTTTIRRRRWNGDDDDDNDDLNLHALRLLYLAFYVHQHEPAWDDVRRRRRRLWAHRGDSNCTGRQLKDNNYDYSCPTAKFLVVPLGAAGLGATIRLTVVGALLAGVASHRVVLFVNDVRRVTNETQVNDRRTLRGLPPLPHNLFQPWPHAANCTTHHEGPGRKRRRRRRQDDFQCFFLPPSPCVLTGRELEDAHVLDRSEQRQLFRNGTSSQETLKGHRVVVATIRTRPHMTPPNVRHELVKIIRRRAIPQYRSFLRDDGGAYDKDKDHKNSTTTTEESWLLERVLELIYEEEPTKPEHYNYFGHRSKLHHAAVMYAMRPRPHYAQLLDSIVTGALPNDFDPQYALGLPIRASDKCLVESECLTFEQYMKVMASVWKTNYYDDVLASSNRRHHPVDIIVTTEDERIMESMHAFEKMNNNQSSIMPFAFRFITNKDDVLQGTGAASDYAVVKTKANVTADQVTLSSLASLKLQLSGPRHVVGNCCSNFHLLLFDFVREQCSAPVRSISGGRQTTVATCLQELEDPEFAVCCAWDKREECVQRRRQRQEEGAEKKNA